MSWGEVRKLEIGNVMSLSYGLSHWKDLVSASIVVNTWSLRARCDIGTGQESKMLSPGKVRLDN